MKYLDGNYYVEVKDHRYKIHPTEDVILRKRDPPTSLRTQCQVQNETKIRRNQKVVKNDDQLIVKNYPKNKQPNIQKQLTKCPFCKQNTWLDIDKGYYCTNCEYIINKQKHQIDEKVLRQDHGFSTRLNYANKKIREIFINMVNNTYNSSQDMINKLQSLKGKTKSKFHKNINKYYIEMKNKNFQTHYDDPFSRNAQGISKIYHELLLLMKLLQTKREFKNMKIKNYDFKYTVIKVRGENKNIDNQYENDENDYINSNDIVLNHYVGIEPRETILR